jgi:diguanylate cyclase (GGDEF)-like protein
MKVLIVDDSKTLRMLVAECVFAMGHQPIHAESGNAALDYVRDNSVDLVLMDVEMPGIDGFETTSEIRKLKQDDWFPIVFLSAKTEDDALTQGILAGGDAYLPKPIDPLRLQLQITAMERIYKMRMDLHTAHQNLLTTQSELMLANEKLEQLALFDQLTGLANRRNYDETISKQFKLAQRQKRPLSLIMCDIDFFKVYNDTYGHQSGDSCLSLVASAIASVPARPTDRACRYGGEEFVVILPETDLIGGLHVAEKIRTAVWERNVDHSGSKVAERVTLSLGVATHTGQYKSTDELMKIADQALYLAKENGRNRVESAS